MKKLYLEGETNPVLVADSQSLPDGAAIEDACVNIHDIAGDDSIDWDKTGVSVTITVAR